MDVRLSNSHGLCETFEEKANRVVCVRLIQLAVVLLCITANPYWENRKRLLEKSIITIAKIANHYWRSRKLLLEKSFFTVGKWAEDALFASLIHRTTLIRAIVVYASFLRELFENLGLTYPENLFFRRDDAD